MYVCGNGGCPLKACDRRRKPSIRDTVCFFQPYDIGAGPECSAFLDVKRDRYGVWVYTGEARDGGVWLSSAHSISRSYAETFQACAEYRDGKPCAVVKHQEWRLMEPKEGYKPRAVKAEA